VTTTSASAKGNELHRAPRTDYSPDYRDGSRLPASKEPAKVRHLLGRLPAVLPVREFQLEHLKKVRRNQHESEAAQPA